MTAVFAPAQQALPVPRDDPRFLLRVLKLMTERLAPLLFACVNTAWACEPVIRLALLRHVPIQPMGGY